MLAAKPDKNPEIAEVQLRGLRYPIWGSAKIDGIRGHVDDGHVWSRKNKLLPNECAQFLFGREEFNLFDGEITVGKPNCQSCFNTTQSAVMSQTGFHESMKFHVFDMVDETHSLIYDRRLQKLKDLAAGDHRIHVVKQHLLDSYEDMLKFETKCLADGWEGICLRAPHSPYKQGRSTWREGWLVKLKRYQDSEAMITGWYEQETNLNEAHINEVGKSKRSSHKENKVKNGLLGGFTLRDLYTGIEFNIGTFDGFTKDIRQVMWDTILLDPTTYMGQIVKYKYFPIGVKDKPRQPILLGFRNPIDL